MSPRRPDPKPTPVRNKAGKLTGWRIRFRDDDAGTNTSRTFDTKREAADFAADVRDFRSREAKRRLAERRAPLAHTGPSLDDVFREFIAWKSPRVRSTRTIEDYQAQWRSISPAIGGHRPVTALTDTDVGEWVDGMTNGTIGARAVRGELVGLSPKTIATRHGLLHSVMGYAVRAHHIAANPCTGTDLPKRRKGAVKGLRPGEWAALHAALEQVDPDAADLALALYATGARFGEVTALSTWDAVDEQGDDGVWRIVLNIGHVIRREAGGIFRRVEDTKSEAGFRRVEVDADASEMFRRRIDRAERGGLVFTNRHGRMWLPATFRASAWVPAVELANLSRFPTPHWLRHTHVQDLLAAGEPLPAIQARVGHENISTTVGVYGRIANNVSGGHLDAIAARRRGGATRPPQIGPTISGEIVDPVTTAQ